MQAMYEKHIRAHEKKRRQEICGMLIVWNVGTPEENSVVLDSEYRHVEYELSPEIELKPFVAPVERTLSRSAAAIHKTLQKFNLVPKPVLH